MAVFLATATANAPFTQTDTRELRQLGHSKRGRPRTAGGNPATKETGLPHATGVLREPN